MAAEEAPPFTPPDLVDEPAPWPEGFAAEGKCPECLKNRDHVIRRITLRNQPEMCDDCYDERQKARKQGDD